MRPIDPDSATPAMVRVLRKLSIGQMFALRHRTTADTAGYAQWVGDAWVSLDTATCKRLLERGWAELAFVDPLSRRPPDVEWRYYRITVAGRAALARAEKPQGGPSDATDA